MSHAGGQQGESVQAFRLERLLGGTPAFGDIAQDHGVADLLAGRCARPFQNGCIGGLAPLHDQRHHIKINEAIGRIENFHVATDGPAALGERTPIETAHPLIELFADRFGSL